VASRRGVLCFLGLFHQLCGMGDATATGGFRACDGEDAHACVLRDSVLDDLDPCAQRQSAGRRHGSGAAGEADE
jgi:hypothetical protein